jgi:hypothetical protein
MIYILKVNLGSDRSIHFVRNKDHENWLFEEIIKRNHMRSLEIVGCVTAENIHWIKDQCETLEEVLYLNTKELENIIKDILLDLYGEFSKKGKD